MFARRCLEAVVTDDVDDGRTGQLCSGVDDDEQEIYELLDIWADDERLLHQRCGRETMMLQAARPSFIAQIKLVAFQRSRDRFG